MKMYRIVYGVYCKVYESVSECMKVYESVSECMKVYESG